eukprot:m.159844 g.159844  ORF g.159844 m.159844 type:complete len:790 (-) comp16352_c11_seq5:88-2457(-)
MAVQLPPWYHGQLSRKEAESILSANGGTSGLFLVRASSAGSGFVLSLCHDPPAVSHYQIRSERIDGVDYLTFDTDTGVAPRFRSLASVIQHLYNNPAHLPVRLSEWIPRPNAADNSLVGPQSAKRTHFRNTYENVVSSALTSTSSSSFTPNGTKASSTETQLPSGESETDPVSELLDQQAEFVASSLLSMVKDSIVAGTSEVKQEDLTNDKLCETAQRYSRHIEAAPDMEIYSLPSKGQVGAIDATTHQTAQLKVGDQLRLVGVEESSGGVQIVCLDEKGRKLKFPASSGVKVLHSALSSGRSSVREHDQPSHSPVIHRRKGSRKTHATLADLVASMGGLNLSDGLMRHSRNFFRETVKEGYLYKLPPPRNRIQTWRRRYFRLVLSLNRSLNGGPVYLEYYSRHHSKKPKGVIDLDPADRVGRPSETSKKDVKEYRNVFQEGLVELHMPRRTYRILASSNSEAQDWIDIIRDVTGLTEASQPASPTSTADLQREFSCVLLNKDLENPEATLRLQDTHMQLYCPQTNIKIHEWKYTHLKSFGYLRKVAWFEAGSSCPTGAGMLCVSCTDAHLLFEAFNYLAPRSVGCKVKRRFSRRHNMSWTSMHTEESEDEPYEMIPEDDSVLFPTPSATTPTALFGQTLSPEDLEPVAVAVPLTAYAAQDENELSFSMGETMRVLATRAFVDQGYWLGQKARHTGYGLIPMKYVEVHEHEFGFMRDVDDDEKSVDSILDDTNAADFEYPEHSKSFLVYGGTETDDYLDHEYEVPQRAPPVLDGTSGYANERQKLPLFK